MKAFRSQRVARLFLACMFHKSAASPYAPFINTPLQRGGSHEGGSPNRFSGFNGPSKTAEAVEPSVLHQITPRQPLVSTQVATTVVFFPFTETRWRDGSDVVPVISMAQTSPGGARAGQSPHNPPARRQSRRASASCGALCRCQWLKRGVNEM